MYPCDQRRWLLEVWHEEVFPLAEVVLIRLLAAEDQLSILQHHLTPLHLLDLRAHHLAAEVVRLVLAAVDVALLLGKAGGVRGALAVGPGAATGGGLGRG